MYIKAVEGDPFQLRHVYDEFRTQEMCIKAVEEAPRMLSHVPDNFKTQKMCKKAFEKKPTHAEICSQYKTQGVCESAVAENLWSLVYVP